MYFYQAIIGSIFVFVLVVLIYVCETDKIDLSLEEELNDKTFKSKVKRSVQKCVNCEIVRKVRVVGGNTTDPGQYPWLAAIKRKSSSRPFCGGSIIGDKFILTAAHCLNSKSPSSTIARLGAHEFSKNSDNYWQDYQVEKFIIHEEFNPFTYKNDIAIIKLKSKIKFTENIQQIGIPTEDSMDFLGQEAIVAGWGRVSQGGEVSQELRHVELRVWDNQRCNQIFNKIEDINENMLCAGDPKGKKDSCQGDSGGPLMIQDQNGSWIVIGLVSYGYGCAQPEYPGVYTRISKYIQWVSKNIEVI